MTSGNRSAWPIDGNASASSHRQILTMLGNRTVVFGTAHDHGPKLLFTPDIDSVLLPRVASSSDISEERILRTLKVANHILKIKPTDCTEADFSLTDPSGKEIFVELKVQDGPPSNRELKVIEEILRRTSERDRELEVWRFSRDEVKLDLYTLQVNRLVHEVLRPLDVWEKTEDSIFRRSNVVERVADWVQRLNVLYEEVDTWTQMMQSVRTEQTRFVTMSEELMHAYVVPDQEIPILDIAQNDTQIASLVPRGLWVIGANGRVDLITREETHILIDNDSKPWGWRIVDKNNRTKSSPFTQATLSQLMGLS